MAEKIISNKVYEPREDSFLIRDCIKNYSQGFVLDVGTGSGILAEEAARYAEKVLAVDINPKVIDYCTKKYTNRKIEFRLSNLFLNISNEIDGDMGKFDLITFNAPYLPNHPQVQDFALDGGEKGYELTQKFLEEAKPFLKENGKILLLISSYTKQKKVEQILKDNNYLFKIISSKKIDFEELFVYLISNSNLTSSLAFSNQKIFGKEIKNKTLLARGKRGVVYIADFGKKKIAIKEKRLSSKAEGTIKKEALWLQELNKHKIGPQFVFYDSTPLQESFAYEFIDGTFLPEFIEAASKKDLLFVLRDVMMQCRKLDELKINKLEMTRPRKHVIVTKITKIKTKKGKKVFELKPVMIDFERCKRTNSPKNVTQFCQFLTTEPTYGTLHKHKIKIEKENVIALAQNYKINMDKKSFENILGLLK